MTNKRRSTLLGLGLVVAISGLIPTYAHAQPQQPWWRADVGGFVTLFAITFICAWGSKWHTQRYGLRNRLVSLAEKEQERQQAQNVYNPVEVKLESESLAIFGFTIPFTGGTETITIQSQRRD